MPNGDRAVVADAKLLDYCLSPTHLRGRHKAKLFEAALGITQKDFFVFKAALLEAARTGEAIKTKQNTFGDFYEIRFLYRGPTKTADVLSVWLIADDKIPRLVTCYPV